jgi:hypothetical protein
MKRTILTHVGTSLFDARAFTRIYPREAGRRLKEQFQRNQKYDGKDVEQACRDALIEGLEDCWGAGIDPWKSRQDSPAEIASLSLLELQPEDRVVLVSSDTNAGSFCAKLIRESVNELRHLPFSEQKIVLPPVSRLEGVETQDGKAFVASGLPSYMKLIARERKALDPHIQAQGAAHVCIRLNITGGYKGLIPFAMIAAQLLASHPTRKVASDLVYYHEEGEQFIEVNGFFPMDWTKLTDMYPRIKKLCEYPDSVESREMYESDEEMHPYGDAKGHPNVLAYALYYLIRDLGWLGS